jgi:hypothetical protein
MPSPLQCSPCFAVSSTIRAQRETTRSASDGSQVISAVTTCGGRRTITTTIAERLLMQTERPGGEVSAVRTFRQADSPGFIVTLIATPETDQYRNVAGDIDPAVRISMPPSRSRVVLPTSIVQKAQMLRPKKYLIMFPGRVQCLRCTAGSAFTVGGNRNS